MKVKTIVAREIAPILSDTPYQVDVRPYSEVWPGDNSQSTQFVQVSIGSVRDNPAEDKVCSYLDFWYDEKGQRLEHVNLKLKQNLKGRRLGGGLVRAMEQVGRHLSCTSVRINVNTNPSFWAHMGYQNCGDFWEKSLS